MNAEQFAVKNNFKKLPNKCIGRSFLLNVQFWQVSFTEIIFSDYNPELHENINNTRNCSCFILGGDVLVISNEMLEDQDFVEYEVKRFALKHK